MKSTLKTIFVSSLLFAVALVISSNPLHAQDKSSSEAQGKTVYDVVKSNEMTSEFAGLLEKSGYMKVLKKEGPYTVLAPSNEAIQNADSELKKNPRKLMKGQLFEGTVPKEQVESKMGIKVEDMDDSASNGIVYIVNGVTTK